MNPFESNLLLVSAIEDTKKLWEVYKTEEIRVYLEYLKGLYDSQFNESSEECDWDELFYPEDMIFFV